jgi:hypothetical protein
VRSTASPAHLSQDDIARRSDQRFAAIKPYLPSRGVIGYIGETGNSAIPDYYLAQYALAPLVIDRSLNHPVVVGNFPSLPPDIASGHVKVVQDFGNGVLLLSNEDAK